MENDEEEFVKKVIEKNDDILKDLKDYDENGVPYWEKPIHMNLREKTNWKIYKKGEEGMEEKMEENLRKGLFWCFTGIFFVVISVILLIQDIEPMGKLIGVVLNCVGWILILFSFMNFFHKLMEEK